MDPLLFYLLQFLQYAVFFIIAFFFIIANNAFKKPGFNIKESDENQIYIAWHTKLPGFVQEYLPKDEVNLGDLLSKGFLKSADNRFEDTINPEVRVARILQADGLCRDYRLTERDGHHFLYRPGKVHWRFSWRAEYRIGPWKKIKSK
ncbi:MAG: hypothetical protein BWY51_00108 [Parcubacteria group bacterium ADurb.Bin316]|nr:MAG: hypothetical protein BWY51_00108 [Parcubacteria group bacterium ADurb.Bin316]HOZ56231.1 hypothetical protein [bacterium]